MNTPLLDADTLKRLEQLSIVSRKISTGRQKGERRSRRRGSSSDFADYRNYVPGDDLRFLDWKIYGRLERLFIKLFLEEEDLRINLLLDVSRSMAFGEPEKLLYARRVCAALGYIGMSRMDSVTVRTFGSGLVQSHGPRRGKVHGPAYLDFLSGIQPAEGTDLHKSFRAFAGMKHTRGVVVVLSDFYDFNGYEEALRQLFGHDDEVLVLHVLSPEELKPTMQGDLRLVDCEFGVGTDVSMGRGVLDAYARTMNTFCAGIKEYVVSRGGYYVLTSTELPFERLVLDVLRRRGLVQ